jgi:peptidoglycan-N-acetylglucosamine deacetylase
MLRFLFASHVSAFARTLGIPRTIAELRAVAPALVAVATPVASGPPAESPAVVAVTFDDGPHPEGTPRILEVLAEQGARATFFLVGEQVVRRPALTQRIVAEGHGIGLHGYRHRPHPSRSAAAMAEDFQRGVAAIADATGVAPLVHRPPYGVYSPASLRIARERGLQPLLWSRWGKDWRKFTTPPRIAARATRALVPGDVILLHDADFYSSKGSHWRTVMALEMILAELNRRKIDTVLPV